MRQFEMYLVFILSATLVSGSGDSPIFEGDFQSLFVRQNSALKFIDMELEFIKAVSEHIKLNPTHTYYCYSNSIIVMYVDVTNVSTIKFKFTFEAMNSLYNEHNPKKNYEEFIKKDVKSMSYYLILSNERNWLPVVYYLKKSPPETNNVVNKVEEAENEEDYIFV